MICRYDFCFIMKAADLPQRLEECRQTALPCANSTVGFNKYLCVPAVLVEYLKNHFFFFAFSLGNV